jgi:hypothetical protein
MPFELAAYENHIFKFDGADIKLTFDLQKHTIDFRQGSMAKYTFTKE